MDGKTISIEGSGRHIHLTSEHLAILCGEGFELEIKKNLTQPGEFASTSRIDVVGPKGTLKGVSVLGPCRTKTQVELSLTDARGIGLTIPVRDSGDVGGSAACTLVGPAGTLELKEGVIAAKRHVHFSSEDAAALGLEEGQIIKVKIGGERGLVFEEVVVRINPSWVTCMHIDYDEMNATGLSGTGKMEGEVII